MRDDAGRRNCDLAGYEVNGKDNQDTDGDLQDNDAITNAEQFRQIGRDHDDAHATRGDHTEEQNTLTNRHTDRSFKRSKSHDFVHKWERRDAAVTSDAQTRYSIGKTAEIAQIML